MLMSTEDAKFIANVLFYNIHYLEDDNKVSKTRVKIEFLSE